jgi:aspartyl/asparaginyl-tRNA synthetase
LIDNNKFKQTNYLSCLNQLHNINERYECGLGDVYIFNSVFRTNKKTLSDLKEIRIIEAKLCFITHNELHFLIEDFVKYCVNKVLENNKNEIDLLTTHNIKLKKSLLNIINGINQQGDFKGKSKKHLQLSYNFIRIYHTIQQQLIKPVEQRENDHKFVQNKVNEYDNLLIDTLEIRKEVRDAYLIATKNYDIFKPLIVGDIENIDIDDDITIPKIESTHNISNKYKFEIDRFIHNF